jgi:hypothetical protein
MVELVVPESGNAFSLWFMVKSVLLFVPQKLTEQ